MIRVFVIISILLICLTLAKDSEQKQLLDLLGKLETGRLQKPPADPSQILEMVLPIIEDQDEGIIGDVLAKTLKQQMEATKELTPGNKEEESARDELIQMVLDKHDQQQEQIQKQQQEIQETKEKREKEQQTKKEVIATQPPPDMPSAEDIAGIIVKKAKDLKLFGKKDKQKVVVITPQPVQCQPNCVQCPPSCYGYAGEDVVSHVEGVYERGVKKEITETTKQVNGARKQVGEVSKQVAGVKNQVKDVGKQVGGVKKQISGLGTRVDDTNKQLGGAKRQIRGVTSRVDIANKQLGSAKKQIKGVSNLVGGVSSQVVGIRNRVNGLSSKLNWIIRKLRNKN